jgi:hypothetical protein
MRGYVMDMTLDPMQVLRQQGHQSWIKGWYEGLANCRMCDHDYIDSQRLKNMEDELLCPNCHSQTKTYAGKNLKTKENDNKIINNNKENQKTIAKNIINSEINFKSNEWVKEASMLTGIQNCFFGPDAAISMTTGNNNICIGFQAQPATITTNNSITLGNSSHNVLRCQVTSITSLSDARDKKEIEELPVGLDFVKGLKPVKFVWDDRDENGNHDVKDFGFIAQDLKKSQEDANLAETLKLVYEENPEKLEASYGKLIPILVKAIQELTAKVEALEAK